VADFFDPDLMGSLPDVRVPDAAPGHWQVVLDLVRESGSKHEYLEGAAMLPRAPCRRGIVPATRRRMPRAPGLAGGRGSTRRAVFRGRSDGGWASRC
jgi:hypothetical protein